MSTFELKWNSMLVSLGRSEGPILDSFILKDGKQSIAVQKKENPKSLLEEDKIKIL